MSESIRCSAKSGCSLFSNGWLAIGLGLFFLGLDMVTKYYTQAYLPVAAVSSPYYPYGGIAVFENFYGIQFSINHATNSGAAWGILRDYQHVLLVFRIVLVIGLSIYALFFNKNSWCHLPFALILSGAIGNIVDYFLYGHVVDMFHFVFWGWNYPVFNVADSAIFVGIAWLFLMSFSCPSNISSSCSEK